jgi:hypothetical protein
MGHGIHGIEPPRRLVEDDAWRVLARSNLYAEQSTFALAAFGLRIGVSLAGESGGARRGAESWILDRLAAFLRRQPDTRWRLVWERTGARRAPHPPADIVRASFDREGELRSIEALLDATAPLAVDAARTAQLRAAIVDAYNETRWLDDLKRPPALRRRALRAAADAAGSAAWGSAAGSAAAAYVDRVLAATWVTFDVRARDDLDPASGRFSLPDFAAAKHPGFGVLNVHCRLGASYRDADLWWQINHAAVDGAAMQDALQRLGSAWGTKGTVVFPSGFAHTSTRRASTRTGDDEVAVRLGFVDFGPLLAERAAYSRGSGRSAPPPVAAFLAWTLAQHPAFRQDAFAIPVDVPAGGGYERTVGLSIARPGRYAAYGGKPHDGFLRYCHDFDAQLRSTRARTGAAFRLAPLLAAVPAVVRQPLLRAAPRLVAEIVGTVGVTILKRSQVFVAPINDVYRCYLALGALDLPSDRGGEVGALTMKARRTDLDRYWQAALDVLAAPEDFLAPLRPRK